MKNAFDEKHINEFVDRINKLTPATRAAWGKMNVTQMLAHCNVSYELVYESKHPKPGAIKKFFLKAFVKNIVVGEKPYRKSTQTASEFIITDQRDFDKEKKRLIDHLHQTLKLGHAHFEGKESRSFGHLSATEWSNMFSKHLDHHLTQFGV